MTGSTGEMQYIRIDGLRVAWHRRNAVGSTNHQPLMIVHGLGSSSREFRYLANKASLAARTLLFIDFPGYGASDKPDSWSYSMEDQADTLASVIETLVEGPVDLVGHSMGGSIAIATATRRRDVINRLVVAEPNLDPGVGELSVHIASQSETRFVERGYRALVHQTRREATRGDNAAARFLVTLEQASPVALHRSSVSLLAGRSPTFREQLESLDTPRATITGANTPPLVPALSDPRIVHYLVENAGHVMMVENPDAFAVAVNAAIETD